MVTGRYEGQRVTSYGDSQLLRPTGIQIARKPLPGPTNREHRKLIGVKMISLGTNYSFYCLECCPVFQNLNSKLQRRLCLMCYPSNKVIKSERSHATFYRQRHRPTSVETVDQNSSFHIESNLDRLGLLSPTNGQRSQQQSGQITLQSVLINRPKLPRPVSPTRIPGMRYVWCVPTTWSQVSGRMKTGSVSVRGKVYADDFSQPSCCIKQVPSVFQ